MIQNKQHTCGEVTYKYVNNTPELRTVTHWCGDWRNCDNCLTFRVNNYRQAIIDAMEERGDIYIVYLDKKEEKEFIKKTRSVNYWRFPLEKETVFLYTETDYDCEPVRFGYHQVMDIPQMTYLVSIEKRKRCSGKLLDLGNHSKSEADSVTIRVSAISFEADQEEENEILAELAAKTSHWDLTEENAEYLLDKRTSILKSILKARGIKVEGISTARTRISLGTMDLISIKDRNPDLYDLIIEYRDYFNPSPQPSPFLSGLWSDSPKEPVLT